MLYYKNRLSDTDKNLLLCVYLTLMFTSIQFLYQNDYNPLLFIIPGICIILACIHVCDQSNFFKSILSVSFVLVMTWIFLVNLFSMQQTLIRKSSYVKYLPKKFENTGHFQKRISNFTYDIFFVESNADRPFLSSKQLCAIESAAINNPRAKVYVVSIRAEFNQTHILKEYTNIFLVKMQPYDLFKDTPLSNWWNKQKVNFKT